VDPTAFGAGDGQLSSGSPIAALQFYLEIYTVYG